MSIPLMELGVRTGKNISCDQKRKKCCDLRRIKSLEMAQNKALNENSIYYQDNFVSMGDSKVWPNFALCKFIIINHGAESV